MKLCVLSLLLTFLAITNASSHLNNRRWPPGCYPSASMCESRCRGSSKACHHKPVMGPEWHICEEVDCETPPAPVHGHVAIPHGTGFESIALYSCEDGYDLSYPAYRTCFQSGKWSGHTPTCDPKPECKDLADPANGDVTLSDGTHQGSLATYSCDAGYDLSDATVRVCLTSGEWSGWEPTCIPYAVCEELAHPEYGTVHFSSIIKWSEAYYTCDVGFVLSYQAHRVCLSTGRWSGYEPICEPIDCGPLEHPCNGIAHTPDGTTIDQHALYECDLGYVLSLPDPVIRICGEDGIWSGEAPCCDPMECPNLTDPSSGSVSTPGGLSVGSIAYYDCDTCYSLNGTSKRVCLANGAWSGLEPTCEATIPGYTLVYGNSCYKWYEESAKWSEALAICTDDGAHLVEITSAGENAAIKAWVAAATNDIWIGLTDQFKEGRMVWYDSHYTLCFEDWWGTEPNDLPADGDCVRMDIEKGFQWRDTGCSYNNNFMCEYEHPL